MAKYEFIDNISIDEIIPKLNVLNDKIASTSKVLVETKRNDSLCRVCEDISTGKHYGQYTCEGCKSFFKRSIRRKTDYICKNNGKCKIYLELRNQCPACRFRKCQHVGMKKDAVQRKRISNSRSPIRKDLLFNKLETQNKQSDEENSSNDWDSDFITTTNLSIKLVLNSVLQAENGAPIHHSDSIMDQSMRIVYAIGEWSKKLLFSDQIQAADKLLLLHNSWCQLFLLNYSLCGLASKLLYRGNSSNTSFYAIQSQLLAMTRVPLDAIEIGCLKAIIFFNPDTYLLFNCSLIDKAQETFQEALEQHIKHTYTDTNRFGKILLRIPYMKEITVRQIMEVFFNDKSDENGNVIYEFFQRLLNTSIKSPNSIKPLLTDI